MLKIRLARHGRKKAPFYRVVVIQEHKKVGGVPVATIGTWFPAKNKISLDKTKVDQWTARGAIVSAAVKKLLK